MAARAAQPQTLLDADLLILDFLAYEATQAMIASVREGGTSHERNMPGAGTKLHWYHSFLQIFKCNHPSDADIPSEIRSRARLTKFVAFYFGRHGQFETVSGEDELRAMRRTHQSRAKEWWASSEHRLDIHPTWRSDSAQHTYSNEALLSRLAKYFSLDPEQFERLENSKPLSLLDVLPFFMEVSADIQCIENKNDANITHEWMTLAAELILQSVLEQWLVYGAVGPDTLSEAFAWGYRKGGANKSCWRAEEMVNDMFREGGSEAEVDGWSAIKEKAMSMLRAPANTALSRQLEDVSKRLPAPALDETVFNFVDAVHQSREKPIMLQLEHGDVQGLSHSEVDRLKARVRWPPENGLGPVFRFSEG